MHCSFIYMGQGAPREGSLMNAGRTGRRADLELVATGAWAKTAKKTYRHASGIVIRYNHTAWAWEVIGGAEDGYMYQTMTVAAYSVERKLP